MNTSEVANGGFTARSAERVALALDVKLRVQGGRPIDAKLLDLSMSGFPTEFLARFRPGDRVWLSLPGLSSLSAIVAWSDGVITGCRFETPLHIAVFDNIRARFG